MDKSSIKGYSVTIKIQNSVTVILLTSSMGHERGWLERKFNYMKCTFQLVWRIEYKFYSYFGEVSFFAMP
jgi:hypothetical protein